MKKVNLLKRLTDKGHNFQIQAIKKLKSYLTAKREEDILYLMEMENQMKIKEKIIRKIKCDKLRLVGQAFRQSYQWMVSQRQKEVNLVGKKRGIMRRVLDTNVRLMSAGYNKLREASKMRSQVIKNKLKFVIKTLTDSDAAMILTAYNDMKQRCLMLNGVGMGDKQMKKVSLIKRITNKSHNFQVMAINSLKEFLQIRRDIDKERALKAAREAKEKDRILRRIMNTNLRFLGMAFKQSYQNMKDVRNKEVVLANKQRGIMRRILDSNTRQMSAGYNKLKEASKMRSQVMKNKLKFVIKTLTDQGALSVLMAYNEFKQRCLMLNGVGMGDAQMKKVS